MLNGAALGLTTLLLLFGLHELLRSYGRNRVVFEPAQHVIVAMTSVIGPLVLLSLQFSNSLDLQRYRAEATGALDCSGGLPDGAWVNLAITGAAVMAVLGLAAMRHRLPVHSAAPVIAAEGVLGFAVVVVMWTGLVLPFLEVSVVTGALFEHLALAVTATATVATAYASWLGR